MPDKVKTPGVLRVGAEKRGITITQENIHNIKAQDFKTIYSNNVAFALSAFDISFIFGEIVGAEGDKITVDQKVRITMSPQHAKVLAHVLVENLKNYEQSVGPIALPTGIERITER